MCLVPALGKCSVGEEGAKDIPKAGQGVRGEVGGAEKEFVASGLETDCNCPGCHLLKGLHCLPGSQGREKGIVGVCGGWVETHLLATDRRPSPGDYRAAGPPSFL